METPPAEKGVFTKAERSWLNSLRKDIESSHAVKGRNVSISDDTSGQTINADDCPPCPPCP